MSVCMVESRLPETLTVNPEWRKAVADLSRGKIGRYCEPGRFAVSRQGDRIVTEVFGGLR